MAYILGVDIGTSGTKTVLFSEDGTPVASALYDYPLYTPCNGYAEQDPALEGDDRGIVAETLDDRQIDERYDV